MTTSADSQESGDLMANYKFQRGGNWSTDNVLTILTWIHICSINLDVMTEATFHYKRLIRRNTILSLLMSTITSTASLTQFNITEENYPSLSTAIKVIITTLATIIALSSGFIKIYQIQEKLEKAIKLQQEWTTFGSILSSELQLPTNLRKDALYLIVKYKDTYTELFKQQADVSRKIVARVAQKNNLEPNDLNLSELFSRISYIEANKFLINKNQHNMFDTTANMSNNMTNNMNNNMHNNSESMRIYINDNNQTLSKPERQENIQQKKVEQTQPEQKQPVNKQTEEVLRKEEALRKAFEEQVLAERALVEKESQEKESQEKAKIEQNTSLVLYSQTQKDTDDVASVYSSVSKTSSATKSFVNHIENNTENNNKGIDNTESSDNIQINSRTSLSGVLLSRASQSPQRLQRKPSTLSPQSPQTPKAPQSPLSSKVLATAKDRIKSIISTNSVENSSPNQLQQRKRMSDLLLNSSMTK